MPYSPKSKLMNKLAAEVRRRDKALDEIDELVWQLRGTGEIDGALATFVEIGEALGMSKEAVWQRYQHMRLF